MPLTSPYSLKIMLLPQGLEKELSGLLDDHTVDAVKEGENALIKLIEGGYDLVIAKSGREMVQYVQYMAAVDPRVEIFLIGVSESEALDTIKKGASACFGLPLDKGRFAESLEEVAGQAAIEGCEGVTRREAQDQRKHAGCRRDAWDRPLCHRPGFRN